MNILFTSHYTSAQSTTYENSSSSSSSSSSSLIALSRVERYSCCCSMFSQGSVREDYTSLVFIPQYVCNNNNNYNNKSKLVWLLSPELEYSLEVRFTTKCLFRFVPLFINTSVDNYTLRNETEQSTIT